MTPGVHPLGVPSARVLLQPPVSDGEEFLGLLAVLLLGFFGGLYLVYDGFQTWKMYRLVQDTPTARVRSMAVGRTELEGTVREHDRTVEPPYTDNRCVYVNWKAERREQYQDDEGNTKYRWETVGEGTEKIPFELEDDTGSALVRADEGAEFDIFDEANQVSVTYARGETPPEQVTAFVDRFHRRQRSENPNADPDDGVFESAVDLVTDMFAGSGDPLTDTSNRRRYEQTVMPVGSEAYLFGSAEPRENVSMDAGQEELLEVRRDEGSGEFLVVDVEEERVRERYSSAGPAKTVGGLAVSAVALYLLLEWYYVPLAG